MITDWKWNKKIIILFITWIVQQKVWDTEEKNESGLKGPF